MQPQRQREARRRARRARHGTGPRRGARTARARPARSESDSATWPLLDGRVRGQGLGQQGRGARRLLVGARAPAAAARARPPRARAPSAQNQAAHNSACRAVSGGVLSLAHAPGERSARGSERRASVPWPPCAPDRLPDCSRRPCSRPAARCATRRRRRPTGIARLGPVRARRRRTRPAPGPRSAARWRRCCTARRSNRPPTARTWRPTWRPNTRSGTSAAPAAPNCRPCSQTCRRSPPPAS